MPDTDDAWKTTRFTDSSDLAHDMQVNIVTFQPGGVIPFPETHVMEHGLYVLEGKAMYLLNNDWVEVEAGDFMWLRAFCPQACYAGGPGEFRYLLYKDMNRQASRSKRETTGRAARWRKERSMCRPWMARSSISVLPTSTTRYPRLLHGEARSCSPRHPLTDTGLLRRLPTAKETASRL
jgi:quercetin dioxygenase-like cupin family protein